MNALVVGGAECVHRDLAALGGWTPDIVIVVNDIGAIYPHRIDHWMSVHAGKFHEIPDHPKGWGWLRQRKAAGGNADFTTWTNRHKAELADRVIYGWNRGSSGMSAVGVALELGADTVVLCGIPMDPTGHFFDKEPWVACEDHREAWTNRIEKMRGRVWSMSGWTRELLGSPPWIADREAA